MDRLCGHRNDTPDIIPIQMIIKSFSNYKQSLDRVLSDVTKIGLFFAKPQSVYTYYWVITLMSISLI